MIFIAVEFHSISNFFQLAINSHAQESFLAQLLKKFLVVPFSIFYYWSKNIYAFAFKFIKDKTQYFILSIFHHFSTRQIRIGIRSPCIKQTQKIINLRCGTNRASRILIHSFLLNRNYWRKPRYFIYIRAFQNS